MSTATSEHGSSAATAKSGVAKPLPSQNPIPLSAAQESQVQQLYYRKVRHICQHEIRGMDGRDILLLSLLLLLLLSSIHTLSIIHVLIGSGCAVFFGTEFAACALNKTFSAAWKCRIQRNAMNDCLIENDTQEHRDRAREEWFAQRAEKRRLEEAEKGAADAATTKT